MRLRSPYWFLSTTWQGILCVALIVATLAYGSMLKRQGEPLNSVLTHGVVTLELPCTSLEAQQMIASLGDRVPLARQQVQLDFGYLLLYPLAFSLACALSAGQSGPRLAQGGLVLAWAVLLAAPLDAVENVALLQMLGGQTQAPWPQLSTICAAAKFTLIFAAAGYILLALIGLGVRRLRRA